MADAKYGNNLDLQFNELRNYRCQSIAALPAVDATKAGWIVRLTTDSKLYVQTATAWEPLTKGGGATIGAALLVARVAAVGNVAIATTKTGDTVDGIVLSGGDKVLLPAQTDKKQNGLYTVGAASLTRSTDAADAAQMPSGSIVVVDVGTANANKMFLLTTPSGFVVGTDNIDFALYPAAGGGGAGLIVDVPPAVGPATDVTVAHNLNSEIVDVTVMEVATKDIVTTGVRATDANNVLLGFSVGPTAGQYRALIKGK